MQSIFKKTLVAAAVLLTTSANAATITGMAADSTYTEKKYPLVSSEGLAIAKTVSIGSGGITAGVTTAITYNDSDLLVLTISGATIKDGASATLLAGSGNEFALLFADTDAGTLTFRAATSSGADSGAKVLSGVVLEDITGNVTISAKGQTDGGVQIDSAKAVIVAKVASEFAIKAGSTKLDAIVDVEQERKQFTAGTTDDFTVDVTSGADLLAVTAGVATVALTGSNLDFLNDKDGDLDSDSYEFDSLTEDTAKTTFEGNTLTVKSTAGYVSSFGMTLTPDGKADADAQALEAQSFSAAVDLAYTYQTSGDPATAGTIASGDLAVGAWKLSGASVNIPYMPYSANASQIIYLSNDGSVDGDIELTAFDEAGNSFGPLTLDVTAKAKSVTKLAPSIRKALASEGFYSGKLDITLVVNSPKDDVEVFASYNAGGIRAYVPVTKAQ